MNEDKLKTDWTPEELADWLQTNINENDIYCKFEPTQKFQAIANLLRTIKK